MKKKTLAERLVEWLMREDEPSKPKFPYKRKLRNVFGLMNERIFLDFPPRNTRVLTMKTPALPPYAPKSPIVRGLLCADNARNYGPAPKGWRWRKVGEDYESGDLAANECGWYPISTKNPIYKTSFPIATPVKFSSKRDPKGRFAPESPKKVELGPKFISFRKNQSLSSCGHNIAAIDRLLANPNKNLESLYGVFAWSESDQGFNHWDDRMSRRKALSPEDLDYLRAAKEFFEKRIVELTLPKPAPAPSLTVPELQAKILSLEAEVRDLKRKIAGAKITFPA